MEQRQLALILVLVLVLTLGLTLGLKWVLYWLPVVLKALLPLLHRYLDEKPTYVRVSWQNPFAHQEQVRDQDDS
jgi:hypothetical protein